MVAASETRVPPPTEYQSGEDPNWNTTIAYYYTQRLITELQAKVIECFATSWTYDGPALT